MGLFSRTNNNVQYGAILDIGSGSVLGAIVESDSTKANPRILWSKREFSPLKQNTDLKDGAKSVLTSLFNIMMLVDSEGRKALYSETGTDKIQCLQVTFSAPWSYTTTKTITYENEEDFLISTELVEELVRTAQKQIQSDLETKEKIDNYGLEVVSRSTMQLIANDYPIRINDKQKAKVLKVIEATTVVQKQFTENVESMKQKMLRSSKLSQFSSMLTFYTAINQLSHAYQNFCLINITFEATELGIARGGVLTYTTYMNTGTFSIAREIADILLVPLSEAHAYLSSPSLDDFIKPYTDKQKESVEQVVVNYREKLTALFKETGDSLSIPHKIFIHGNLETEAFFNEHVAKAAKANTRLEHAVYNVTNELLTKNYTAEELAEIKKRPDDTALLISAQFFHTRENQTRFEQL